MVTMGFSFLVPCEIGLREESLLERGSQTKR